ncbi:MAG: hypothetical protein HYV62_14915 [Candidatus Rokubacteria bacterium]|nr:hypothetical protein [Candidatus Rokubacteria bacterium]
MSTGPRTPARPRDAAGTGVQQNERADKLYHLAADVIDRVPQLGASAAYLKQALMHRLIEHREYVVAHGEDMPEIRDWRWGASAA